MPRNIPKNQTQTTLLAALESGKIDRIEIEVMPKKQFRWKIWADGRLVFCMTGKGTANEIDAMIESTGTITKTMLGVDANA